LEIEYLIKGIMLGLVVTAPLGPLGIMCIQRTINRGVLSGLVTGVASAFGDIMYALVAGFGLSVIAHFLNEYQLVIRVVGGVIVSFLGVRIYFSNPIKQFRQQKVQKQNYVSDFISGLLLTITNPVVIVVFGAAFASFGLDKGDSVRNVIVTIIGVFVGAIGWWISLTALVNIFRDKINLRKLWWINKITGVFVLLFGVIIIVSIFFKSLAY